jgi:hypothetical protein
MREKQVKAARADTACFDDRPLKGRLNSSLFGIAKAMP